MIREMIDHNGVLLKTGEEIKAEEERFFQEVLTNEPTDYQGMPVGKLEGLFQFRCGSEDIAHLEQEVTKEEIQENIICYAK